MTDWKIKNLYEMLYPYGHYNGDAAFACIAINRELKKICDDKFRLALLIIGRSMGHTFKPDTPTKYICQTIQNDILDFCLGPSLSNEDKAKVITGLKLGVARPMSDLALTCQKFKSYYSRPLDVIVAVRDNSLILSFLNEWFYIFNRTESYWENLYRHEDFKYFKTVFKLLKEEKYSEVLKMGIEKSGGMMSKKDVLGDFMLTVKEEEFLNYIIEGMLSGRFKITSSWDDICKNV